MKGLDETRTGYLACMDVFPPELNQRALAALGKARKVHFAKGNGKFTKTEQILLENDVYTCRDLLDRYETQTRTVLFAPYKYREVPRHVAFGLAKEAIAAGCTLRACADGIGYHFNSIVQWKIRKGTKEQFLPPNPERHVAYSAAGRDHCAKLESDVARAPTAAHYVWVGWVRERVAEALTEVRANVAHLAQAGGPVDAAVAVYRLPAAVVAAWAPEWKNPRLVLPPTDDLTELRRLERAARAYCTRQSIPFHQPRLLSWVQWFLDYTELEEAPRVKNKAEA